MAGKTKFRNTFIRNRVQFFGFLFGQFIRIFYMDGRYSEAVLNIVNTQKLIIGPLAIDMAKKVANITFLNGDVQIAGDPVKVLHELVKEYEVLFGEA